MTIAYKHDKSMTENVKMLLFGVSVTPAVKHG